MKLSTIKNITKSKNKVYDITVENNHNFFCNNHLIHNCDYRGEIMVALINLGQDIVTIQPGDKIAQIIFEYFASVSFSEATDLTNTQRNDGGFGSTDKPVLGKPEKIVMIDNNIGKSLDEINKELH